MNNKFIVIRNFLFLILLISFTQCNKNQQKKLETSTKNFVLELLNKMTLEEKIGQMTQYNGFWDVTGPVPEKGDNKIKYEHLKKGLVGAVLNVKGVNEVRKIQEIAVKETRLGIPLLFGFDVIHGYKTISPIPLAEAASWNLEAIEKSAQMAATEASAVGINWTFAPMLDISRDPRWGRVMEGSGEDPFLASQIGVARIKGFQGKDLKAVNTIAATAKHFAGYGFAESGRDYNTVDVGTSTLYNVIFPPFKAAIENNVQTVMNSFNVINGIPATANKWLQRDILKNKWNFKGFVVSDWGSGLEMIEHGYAKDLNEVAVLSANAGSDMDMESYAYAKELKKAVETGKVDIKIIDEAVERILNVKFELGLFDAPFKYCNIEREKSTVYKKEFQETVLDMARESIVLLKNTNNVLPLNKNQKNIAVIGALANDKNSPLGSWRIGSDDSTAISVIEGLQKYSNNISYSVGANLIKSKPTFIDELVINNTDKTGFKEAIDLAQKSSIVIMVLGEHGFQSGEGRSRSDLGLPGVQQELLEEVYKVNSNIILVLMNGRPLTISWANDHLPAIVEAWQLGSQSGNAIADVLFGAYNPNGKLPMTFPKSVGQIPLYYNHFNTGRPGPKKEVFWSHYSDISNKPLYPFGFGLSYSKFDYSNLKVKPLSNNSFKVSVSVKNVGRFTGKEIIQLYVRDIVASVVRPVKELKGFQKLEFKSNEEKIVEFILTEKELGFYNNDGQFIIEPGEFEIMVGANSENVLMKKIRLKQF